MHNRGGVFRVNDICRPGECDRKINIVCNLQESVVE
jgi:hypothetical protein